MQLWDENKSEYSEHSSKWAQSSANQNPIICYTNKLNTGKQINLLMSCLEL